MASFFPPPTSNVLLGAGLTILTTLATWTLLHFNQRRVERDRTRRAIIHETNHIAANIQRLIDLESGTVTEADIDHVIVSLSPDVLDEDFHQINKLTSQEVEVVYKFYELTRVLQRKIKEQDRSNVGGEEIKRVSEDILDTHEEIQAIIKRSRLSLFTEWYKAQDRTVRNG